MLSIDTMLSHVPIPIQHWFLLEAIGSGKDQPFGKAIYKDREVSYMSVSHSTNIQTFEIVCNLDGTMFN
jgi:hypothetical protein